MRPPTKCVSKRSCGARHGRRFQAVLDEADKLFGKSGQCYFPSAAGEESFFAHGLASGDIPVANQAKREIAVEALSVSLGHALPNVSRDARASAKRTWRVQAGPASLNVPNRHRTSIADAHLVEAIGSPQLAIRIIRNSGHAAQQALHESPPLPPYRRPGRECGLPCVRWRNGERSVSRFCLHLSP